jgi:hypothetical protein
VEGSPTIVLGGRLNIRPKGKYQRRNGAIDVSASLTAADIMITGGSCEPFVRGGEMTLDNDMSVEVTGSLELVGTDGPSCGAINGQGRVALGITPPPKFRVRERGSVTVTGTVRVSGPAATTNSSRERGVTLSGDFDNQSVYPSLFDWTDGRLVLNGTAPQDFEVAGLDLCTSVDGFSTDEDTLFETAQHTNFSMGTLEVGTDVQPAAVTFVNRFANTKGVNPCDEALYVDELILKTGSTVTLLDCRIYYNTLDKGSEAKINSQGCGGVFHVTSNTPPQVPTVADEVTLGAGQNTATTGESLKNRFISVMGGDAGHSQALRITFGNDLPSPYDIWNGMELWVKSINEICENGGASSPPCPIEPNLPKDTFWGASTTCEASAALFTDWTQYDLPVHIFSEGLIPAGSYSLQFIDASCQQSNQASYSDPLVVIQPKWGDVLDNCGKNPCGAPQGITNIGDVTGILAKFQNLPGAPIKSRADLVGLPGNEGVVDHNISIVDVTWNLDAFIGGQYDFPPGVLCPAP